MRISDWSSDVCSSDLVLFPNAIAFDNNMSVGDYINRAGGFTNNANGARIIVKRQDGSFARAEDDTRMLQFGSKKRSEEHKSELQSLMRIAYAVFCLKKKKKGHTISQHICIRRT